MGERAILCYSFAVESEHQQIEELKQLVRRNIELSQETHKVVESMHRHNRWATIFHVLRIVVLVVIAGGIYYFLQPYVDQVRNAYEQVRGYFPGAQE